MAKRTYIVEVDVDEATERRERGPYWQDRLPDWIAETIERDHRARISGLSVTAVTAA